MRNEYQGLGPLLTTITLINDYIALEDCCKSLQLTYEELKK